MRSRPGERQRVGPVPAATAFDVEGVPRAAGGHGDRVLDREQLVHAVGVHRELHVVGVGDVERAAQLLGPGADVLVDLEPAAAGAQRLITGPGRAEDARTSRQALSGCASSAAQVARSPSSGLQPRFQTGPVVLDHERRQAAGQRRVADLRREPVHVGSMPPGVAIRPRPSTTAVEVSSTTSIASIVSGFPARPPP